MLIFWNKAKDFVQFSNSSSGVRIRASHARERGSSPRSCIDSFSITSTRFFFGSTFCILWKYIISSDIAYVPVRFYISELVEDEIAGLRTSLLAS